MDVRQFLAEFGHIASAPDGVQRLREMIYNLAITGDLTEQLPEDGNTEDLLEEIERERQRRIKAKEFKRTAKLESEPLDIPANIKLPDSWRWTRLLDIGEISPRNEAKDDVPAAFISMSGIPQFHKGKLESELRNWGDIKKGFTHFANGDVVVAKITPCFENGKAAVISGLDNEQGIGAGTTELHVFRPIYPEIHPAYIYVFLRSPYFAVKGEQSMTGTAGQKRLPTEYFATRALSLPPFAEQARIVAKVDELMALCDRLETQQQERQKLKKLVRTSSLDAFVSATNPADLKQSWMRLESGLEFWGDDEQTPFELSNAIGAIACRGLLTDSGALQPVANGDSLPPLPEGWGWQTLGDLSTYITSGSRGWKQYLATTGEIFIRSQDIKHDAVVFENPAYVLLPEKSEGKRTLVQPGDLLLTITGGNVGKCAQVPELPKPAYVSQHVALIRIKDPESTPFIHFWMTNIYGGRKFLGRYIYGDKPGLNLTQVASVPVPMPPKEIQAQIAGSLEHYSAICNRLLKQVTEAKETARLLAAAAVVSITGIRTEVVEELKVPKTEMISKLRLGATPNTKAQA